MPGKIVFRGIGIGKCQLVQEIQYKIREEAISPTGIEDETKLFEKAKAESQGQIEGLKAHALEHVGEEESAIFDAHLMMIDDPMFTDSIRDKITSKAFSAEKAIVTTRDEFIAMFRQIDNEYIKERAKDIEDVSNRMLDIILGVNSNPLENIAEATVVVAKDLKPSQTVLLNANVKGIVLEIGSVTSHAAIVAKAKGIPTIIGEEGICNKVNSGDLIVLDARENKILVNPDSVTLYDYKEKEILENKEKERLKVLKDLEAITKDGHRIKLYGNAGSAMETRLVGEQGGRGVGLLRTEFLYMENTHFPTEEEQFVQYKKIAETAGEEVIIRTLDIGGDKTLPYFKFPQEMNPFLGYRAIRFCLDRRDIFDTQLRAILRASVYGKIKIMFPMIATMDELRRAKQCVENAKEMLKAEGIAYDSNVEVGIMVEIPAAAVMADLLAKEADFFSIGTNDLCQYTMAVDRMNANISKLYQPLNPGIIRLIDSVAKGGHKEKREVGVCGEMASDELGALILIGLGIDELSVSPSMIPAIKEKIRSVNYEDLKIWVEDLKNMTTEAEVIQDLERRIRYADQ